MGIKKEGALCIVWVDYQFVYKLVVIFVLASVQSGNWVFGIPILSVVYLNSNLKIFKVPLWYTKKLCNLCGKYFADSKCLKKHVQTVHSKLKPYICQVCNHQSAR